MCIVYTRWDRQHFDSEIQTSVKPVVSSLPMREEVKAFTVEAQDEKTVETTQVSTMPIGRKEVIDTVPEDHPLYGLTVEEAKAKLDTLMTEAKEEHIPMLDEMIRENKELLANLPDWNSVEHDMSHPIFDYARPLIENGATLEDLQRDPEFIRLSNDMTNQLTGVDDILKRSIERQKQIEEELSKPLPRPNKETQ